MRIWIDFINTPQVSFFEPLILELQGMGHEFVLTCRNSSNTVQLLDQKGWKVKMIGKTTNHNLKSKLMAYPLRVIKLVTYIKSLKIDVAIGQSSFYLPISAKICGIPSIYTNDNEHALGNIPSFLFADKIFLPENMSLHKAYLQGAKKNKIVQYPGIKEGVYLWIKARNIQLKREKIKPNTIYIRPEPQTAQYYMGKLNFLDNLLLEIQDLYNITILVRDSNQFEHYSQAQFKNIKVPNNTLEFEDIAESCLLFIGAGGSMTREMAIIGIPTISVYQGALLDVDQFLISEKLMFHETELTKDKLENILCETKKNSNTNSLMEKGKCAYDLFINTLLMLNSTSDSNLLPSFSKAILPDN